MDILSNIKKSFLIRADVTPQLDPSPPPHSHCCLTKSLNPLRQTSHEGPPGTDRKAVLAVGLCSQDQRSRLSQINPR